MSHVMISYQHEDQPFVIKLAAALKTRACEVWFDQNLLSGEDFTGRIEQKIDDAGAVLVVWSNKARDSSWVRAETLKAFNLNKLVQVIKEPCLPRWPFDSLHFTDLSGWAGDPSASKIDELVTALDRLRNRKPLIDVAGDVAADSRTNVREIAPFLDAAAKIKIVDQIATGELSDVYRGQYGRRWLAIKAIRNSVLPNAVKQTLLEEITLASNLIHPSFLRISDALFHGDICFIVSDYVEGGTTIGRKLRTEGVAAFSIDDVVDILNQLCDAIVEADVTGLGYLSISPSQVFVREDKTQVLLRDGKVDVISEANRRKFTRKIAQLSPINFRHFRAHFLKTAATWDDNSGPFMAPELWHGNHWFKQRMQPLLGRTLEGEELRQTKLQKSRQFALGMVAWTMLEGKVPFTPDLNDADPEDIKAQFLASSETFSEQVAEAPWRNDARALMRIIQRMVHHDPAKRWSSMNQVRLLIGALAANYAGNNLDDLVKEAYQIAARGKQEFFRDFYERLFQKAPHLRAKFPSDMSRQHAMLDYAVGQLLNFDQQQSEPTTLTQFVERHRGFGLSGDDFRTFGNALIETFDAGLTETRLRQRMMAALEIVIWPGIYYMIQQCVPPDGGASSSP